MVISSGVVAVTAAIVHSVMTIQDGMVSSKIRAEQRELEKKALEEDMMDSFLAYRQLCQLREELELEAYQARRMQAKELLLDNLIFSSEMSNLKDFKLRIPPIALTYEVLMNMILDDNQSERMVDSNVTSTFLYKPMKVFMTPTNDEMVNKSIWGNVGVQLEDFFDERYNCNNTHQVTFFTDAWKNETDLINPVPIKNIRSVTKKEPIVIVTASCSDNKLSITLYFWGIYGHEKKEHIIPNNTDTSFFTFTINPDGANEELIQDIYSQIKASICFLCDIYTWNQYHIVPVYPNISKLENSIEPSMIEAYISILGNSITSGELSSVLDMKQLLNYAKTIDEAFDSKECSKYLFKSIDNKNSRKSKSIIDPCMGAASNFLKKLKDFLEEELESASEQAENIMKQIEGSAEPLDQDNKRSDNRTNRSASESIKGPDFSIVSPRYNYTTWDFCKNNSSFYGFSNDYVHGLYISYVQSVIDYQSRRYFEAELKKHKIPWNQNLLFKNLESQLRDFVDEKIAPIVFHFIEESLNIGKELNTLNSEKQYEYKGNKRIDLKKIICKQLIEGFNEDTLNRAIIKVRYHYIITQILSSSLEYLDTESNDDKAIIKSDELSSIVPNSVLGEVSSEELLSQREIRASYIKSLKSRLSENENNHIIHEVTNQISATLCPQQLNKSQTSYLFPHDIETIIDQFCIIELSYCYDYEKTRIFSPDIYKDTVELTEDDRKRISSDIKMLADVMIYSKSLIEFFLSSDLYTPETGDEYGLDYKVFSKAVERKESPFAFLATYIH